MNIMLFSVAGRLQEIGILMSIGANKRDILLQFVSELVAFSLSGGIIGIAFTIVSCRVINTIAIPSIVNPSIIAFAAGFAVLIGIFFSSYPAQKSSVPYLIDALRYE
jgi:putative ABC transport system permease protein